MEAAKVKPTSPLRSHPQSLEHTMEFNFPNPLKRASTSKRIGTGAMIEVNGVRAARWNGTSKRFEF